VVVCNLDLVRVSVPPFEADSVLVINANAALTFPVAPEQPVAGRQSQVAKCSGGIQKLQFLESGPSQARRNALTPFFLPEPFRPGIPESLDHPVQCYRAALLTSSVSTGAVRR